MTIDEFKVIDLRAGTVLESERVSQSEKLVKLQVDLGADLGKRQVVAGIGKKYSPEELVGKQIIVVANLDPRKFVLKNFAEENLAAEVILESQGMLLAAHDENGDPVILTVERNVPPGSKIS